MRRGVKAWAYTYTYAQREMMMDARAHAHTHHTPHTQRKVDLMMGWTNTCTHIYVQLIQDHIKHRPRDVKGGNGTPLIYTLCMNIHMHVGLCLLGQDISSQNRCRHCDFRLVLEWHRTASAAHERTTRKKQKQY